jgi:hypothetical protein
MNASYRISASKQLIRFAWIVEVIAVLIGLGISLAVAHSGWASLSAGKDVDISTYLNVLIGAAPFVLIAVVELTKIPLSGAAYYASRWYWKGLFTVALLFVAAVTFETMFNGLERQFASTKHSIDIQMDSLTNYNEKRIDLVTQRDEASKLTLADIETFFNDRTKVLQDNFNASAGAVDQKYRTDKAGTVNEYADMLRQDVERLTAQLGEIKTQHAAEISSLNINESGLKQQLIDEQSGKRRALQQQYNSVTSELSSLNKQYESAGIFASNLKRSLTAQIAQKNQQQTNIAGQINTMISGSSASEQLSSGREKTMRRQRSEVANLEKQLQETRTSLAVAISDFESGRTTLSEQIAQEKSPLIEEYENQRTEAAAMRDRQLEDLKNREGVISSTNLALVELDALITDVRAAINVEGRGNQVYRMAAMAYNKDSIAELQPSEIGTVGTVWFGSLAAIVAFTGILLALGSYAIRTEPKAADPRQTSARVKLARSLRSLIVNWKHARRKSIVIVEEKIITKKIPVEKVVDRIVDREVEVLVTKFVPMPATPDELKAIFNEQEKREKFSDSLHKDHVA